MTANVFDPSIMVGRGRGRRLCGAAFLARATVAVVVATIWVTPAWGLTRAHPTKAFGPDSLSGPLVVSTASSMRSTVQKLVAEFVAEHPRVVPEIETVASVTAARALVSAARVPDVLVTDDDTLIDALLMPQYATWSAGFARSVLVLAYTRNSKYADEISTRNWVDVLTRPDVHGARGDPEQDPAAYRTVMFFHLAASYYMQPRLPTLLEHAMPITDLGPGGRDLEARFASGVIDYMPTYRTWAADRGLEWIELPSSVNLGDTAFAASYAAASVRIANGAIAPPDTVTIRGAPILYGVTVPRTAPHPAIALAFARFVLSPDGQDVVRNAGFDVPGAIVVHGTIPAGLRDGD